MQVGKWRITTVGVAFALCACAGWTSAADAKVRTPSLKAAPRLSSQKHGLILYRVSVPAHDTARLQARTKHGRWETIAKLQNGNHSTSTPDLNPGTYYFRVIVTNRLGGIVMTSRSVKTTVVRPPAPPSVSFTLPTAINAGAAILYSWSVSALPAGDSVVLQQPQGTPQVWQTIATLPGASGSSTLAGLSLGAGYRYRIAVVDGVGKVLSAKPASIDVYGQVPFSTLFGVGSAKDVYSTPAASFPFVTSPSFSPPLHGVNQGTTSKVGEPLSAAASLNDCDLVHVDFVGGDADPAVWPSTQGNAVSVEIVQQSQASVTASQGFNVEGSLDAQVIPGQSWGVEAYATFEETTPYELDAYINGYAMCDSTKEIAH